MSKTIKNHIEIVGEKDGLYTYHYLDGRYGDKMSAPFQASKAVLVNICKRDNLFPLPISEEVEIVTGSGWCIRYDYFCQFFEIRQDVGTPWNQMFDETDINK